ncbi:MAG: PAS domain S-box protein [Acidobacteria bacterium]|nr:PAS domain S-box protein [Acidobacteriota bacterium]
MVGTVQDITERKRAESQMLVQAAALESAANAIVITDRDGCITWVNPSFTRLTGFSAEEAIGKNPRILKSGQQEPAFYRQMWQTMLAGNVWRGEVINKRKDGTLYYEDMTITPVHDSTGEICHFVAIKQDVTSQKKAEEALRQSEARLRGLFENATLGVYRSTRDGRFLEVNPALVSMLGYNSREELLAISIAEDIYANSADRERALKDSAESFQNVPLQWKRKDGTPVSVLLTGRVVRDAQGAFAYFESFVEDVTERQALEKQFYAAQKFEAIGHLAGGVAHDFNNVLGAILGWAELGLDSVPEDSKVRKNLKVIIEQAQHAAGLTRQLLAFARRQHMEPRVLNLNNSVREVFTLLGSVIGRDIELKTSLAPHLSSVLADPTHLEQVLMNLCVNARDAMPRGGKLIIETRNATVDEDYCRLHPYAQPGQYAQLSVSDTGVGIDAATLDRIFEPFFTTKELGKGTGLGLATVYGIVKQHGGFIHAYSELGQGTTFHLYFPACPEAPLNAKKAEAPALRGGTETILLAEDNEDLAALARAALEGACPSSMARTRM